MAVKIEPQVDERAERMIADPKRYFASAREEARRQVVEEMERERAARKRR